MDQASKDRVELSYKRAMAVFDGRYGDTSLTYERKPEEESEKLDYAIDDVVILCAIARKEDADNSALREHVARLESVSRILVEAVRGASMTDLIRNNKMTEATIAVDAFLPPREKPTK